MKRPKKPVFLKSADYYFDCSECNNQLLSYHSYYCNICGCRLDREHMKKIIKEQEEQELLEVRL